MISVGWKWCFYPNVGVEMGYVSIQLEIKNVRADSAMAIVVCETTPPPTTSVTQLHPLAYFLQGLT